MTLENTLRIDRGGEANGDFAAENTCQDDKHDRVQGAVCGTDEFFRMLSQRIGVPGDLQAIVLGLVKPKRRV
ncbi:MAG TPA: hypothetical protein VFP63_01275 [Dehalococcoidia bacterium]|nr:hypothetical protein [Dehalococcoidia bacterium]